MVLPAPYLVIGGNSFAEDYALINSISMTAGRQSLTEQPAPSTFRCTLVIRQNQTISPIEPGDSISWKLDNGTYSNKRIFGGYVSDVQISLNWLSGEGYFTYQITGVGYLANLNRCIVGASGYAKQYDGTRIANIISDCGYSTTGITTPGSYEIAVYNSGATNALTLAQEAAQSAMGVLYEDHDDYLIRYQSYSDRKNNPTIELTTDEIIANTYGIGVTMNEIVNQVALTYGTGSTGTTYNNTTSQNDYGIRSGVRETTLHNLSDANSIAQILLATRAFPSYNLTTITVNTATLTAAKRLDLMDVTVGTQIHVSDLPNPELQSFTGFVEGYQWSLGQNQEILTMTVSNYGNSYPYTLWNDLNFTNTWNTIYTATKTWEEVV